MDANKRLVLTVIISIGILVGFQLLFPHQPPPAQEETAPAEGAPSQRAEVPPVAPGEAPAGEQEAAPRREERTVTLQTEALRLVLSSHGGAIAQAELLGPKGRRQGKDAPQVDLAEGLEAGDPRLFSLQTSEGLPQVREDCEIVGQSAEEVTFDCGGPGLGVTKTYRIQGDRVLQLETTLRNRTDRRLAGAVELVIPARVNPAEQGGPGCAGFSNAGTGGTSMVCGHGEDVTHTGFERKEPVLTPAGPANFAGIEERYFLAVAVPAMAQPSSCQLVGRSESFLETHLRTPIEEIGAGESQTLKWELVIGQKELGFLQQASASISAAERILNPRLDETVDLGFWAAIARILLWMMNLFHSIIPNWGVAIILLTLAIKVLTFPLTWKSMKSMEAVRKLAPEIEKLKKKHGDDREKLNVETMQLYQRHKVNPLGGCLPMLIQMPIWLALYTTLQSSVELYNEPFLSPWISDLTSKDPFYILPISMGVTMFVTQKLQPMQMDATQQKMMLYFMPIFFTFIMLQLPAGLTLYIFTNNILSIVQQLWLRKVMSAGEAVPAAATTVEAKRSRKK